MGYIEDYCYFASGTEVPEEYLRWGALSILGHVLGHKVWVQHGDYFPFYPNLYVCLVGNPGSGKNTALSINFKIMLKVFPDMVVSSSVQSPQDMLDKIASPDCVQTWKDETGVYREKVAQKIYEYRSFYVLNNELASFLEHNKIGMVKLLTEGYDGDVLSTGYKGQRIANPERNQVARNPFISLLAGAVPDWFMGDLKLDLFKGGLGRRLIIVNCDRNKIVPVPKKPVGADDSLLKAIAYLKEASSFFGQVNLTPAALKWWEPWYIKHKQEVHTDPILLQFHGTKSVAVLKVAMLLSLSNKLSYDLEAEYLELALSYVHSLEPKVVRLTSGLGRNDIAAVGVDLMSHIERLGGAVPETVLLKAYHRYLRDPEFIELCNHFCQTGELVVTVNGEGKRCWFLADRYQTFLKEKATASQAQTANPSSPTTVPTPPVQPS